MCLMTVHHIGGPRPYRAIHLSIQNEKTETWESKIEKAQNVITHHGQRYLEGHDDRSFPMSDHDRSLSSCTSRSS